VLTASDDLTAKLWDANTGQMIRTFAGHDGRVTSAIFSPDGKYVFTASGDKTARMWDAATAKQLHVFKGYEQDKRFVGHQWGVLSLAYWQDKDGQQKRLITGSADNTACIWDVDSEKVLQTLAGHTAAVAAVAFAPDGLRVMTGSQDDLAKLWDATKGKEILSLKAHSQEVTAVSFSPNGRYVLTASRDGRAILWLATPWRDATGGAETAKNLTAVEAK
jgi:hypothetical protein